MGYVADYPSVSVCLMFFSWLDGVVCFRRKNRELPFFVTSDQGTQHWSLTVTLAWIPWPRSCFQLSPLWSYSLPLSLVCYLKASH